MGFSFFTALAPEEQAQGSRDPLGLLPIWSRVGRGLAGNVTTVSGDLRGWTSLIVMVGLYADRVAKRVLDESDTEPLFRAEQLIAYSRVLHSNLEDGSAPVRGLNLVKRRLQEADNGNRPIPLGLAPDRRILGAQQSAGVLGQIGSPAIASGLLERSRTTLAPAGIALWQAAYRPLLRSHDDRITALLKGKVGFEPAQGDAELARVLAQLHAPALTALERAPLREQVLHGGRGADTAQACFVRLCLQPPAAATLAEPCSIVDTILLAEMARDAGFTDTGRALQNIVAAERLLSPMVRLFGWVQGRHRQALADVVAEVSQIWGQAVRDLDAGTQIVVEHCAEIYSREQIASVLACSSALAAGHWERALQAVIEINGHVMQRRGGAPWVRIENGRVDVRLQEGEALLGNADALRTEMLHSYYLDPLRRLIHAWRPGEH